MKYEANTNSWMTINICDNYLIHPDRKVSIKNCNILLFINQCAAHPKNTTLLSNIKAVFLQANCISQLHPLDWRITHALKCHYRKQLIRKTAAMTDGGLLKDATQMKLDVLSAMHFTAEAWSLITPNTIKTGQ
jgi:hypothetical protein